ncbi:MAG: SDR family oxidoreductase [Paludibacter sp.]|nr:SDR family oxidoreductase [Paludibacter sp.]
MINLLNFTDKQILIAGASTGIGKDTAILLSKLGAKLILLDINEDGLKEVSNSLEGSEHHYCRYDLSDLDGIEPQIKNIVSTYGALDGFVHCVGVRSRRPVSMLTPDIIREVLNINFGSFVELIRCITKKNHFNVGLSIVGISSISSQRGGPSVTAYAASKGAMDSAVRCLAKELATKKIRVNTVVPAQINTPAFTDLIKNSENGVDATLSRQYLGLGDTIDVASVIAFLLSDSSKFITGAAIPVDGGFLSS